MWEKVGERPIYFRLFPQCVTQKNCVTKDTGSLVTKRCACHSGKRVGIFLFACRHRKWCRQDRLLAEFFDYSEEQSSDRKKLLDCLTNQMLYGRDPGLTGGLDVFSLRIKLVD